MSTPTNLNVIFTPQAAHNTAAPIDRQQYVIDWQNLLLAINNVLNGLASLFIPAFPSTANGIVYVASGVPGVITGSGLVYELSNVPGVLSGTGLVYENASVPGFIAGSGTVFVASGVPSVLGGTGWYYQISSSPTLGGFGTSPQVLTSNGPSTAPTFQAIRVALGLSSAATGVLTITSGVTGATAGTEIVRADGSLVTGDGVLVVTGGGTTYTSVAGSTAGAIIAGGTGVDDINVAPAGTSAQILTSNGTGAAPTFNPIRVALGLSSSATGVLTISSGVTGATAGTEIVRADGSLVAADGVLLVTGGGTGYTSLSGATSGAVVAQGVSVDSFQVVTASTAGKVLTSNGSTTPTFQSPGLSGFSNVTGSRAVNGTVYNNGGAKPLWVIVWCNVSSNQGITCKSDASNPPNTFVDLVVNIGASGINMVAKFWVLPGHFYNVSLSAGTFSQWLEYS